MGHSKMDVTRIYHHPDLKEIRRSINKRNEFVRLRSLPTERAGGPPVVHIRRDAKFF